MMMTYLDFDIQIEAISQTDATGKSNRYRVRVLASPAGQAESFFTLPFDEKDLHIFVLSMGQTRNDLRKLDSLQMRLATEIGSQLYHAVFQDQVLACFLRSLDEAAQKGVGLRLRLRLDSSLINLPWEFLYDTTHRRFLSHSKRTPIVRYLELPQRIPVLPVNLPLKVLVMIASPDDHPALNVEQEWSKVKGAVKDLEERGLLQLSRLEDGTLAALRRKLLKETFHIFHYIGHGAYDAANEEGLLLLEDEQGRARRTSSTHLATLLHDHASLRLVLLNACEGARTAVTDRFAGVAQHLVLQGLPAVIAMQFEITDQAAITLSQAFYEALATGMSVDGALAEARKALFAEGNDVEWGTPVLYMRATDGRLFDLVAERHRAKRVRALIPEPIRTASSSIRIARAMFLLLLLLVSWFAWPVLHSELPRLPTPTAPTQIVLAVDKSPGRLTPKADTADVIAAMPPRIQTSPPMPTLGGGLTSQRLMTATITAPEPPSPTVTSTPQATSTATTTADPTHTVTPLSTFTATATSTATFTEQSTAAPSPTTTAMPSSTATTTNLATVRPLPSPTSTRTASPAILLRNPPQGEQIGSTWTEPSSGIRFAFVPAGSFLMGSSNADIDASDDEKPAHTNKTAAYWLGSTEVTNAQFSPFVLSDGYSNQAYWTAAGWAWRRNQQISQPGCWNDANLNQSNQPVVCVSWYEAISFAAWLSTQSGLDVRLPTEAEWEKAARGVNGLLYPWGNEFDDSQANYCDRNCPYGWRSETSNDGFARTAPVGSYARNVSPYGVLDMAGNVWEWTNTLYRNYPYKSDDRREDLNGEGSRVARGGSWSNRALFVRAAERFSAAPTDRNDNLGFRLLVLVPVEN